MIFRRFRYVRMRVILRQQFEIERLEKKLQRLDEDEDDLVALVSQEKDNNEERNETLNQLKENLAEYDSLLQRNQWAMRAPEPTPDHVETVRTELTHRLVKSERGFIDEDVLDIGGSTDPKSGKLYNFSENIALWSLTLWLRLGKRLGLIKIRGPVIVQGIVFRRIARTLAAGLSVLMLLLPMIILNFVETGGVRLAVVSVFSMVFISALTVLSAAGTMEIFLAGAAYAAVLVVYVSQSGDGN
ncbi:hypothetical protein IWZ00DRAFT_565286 [Phyllosticta capitalensis]